MGSDQGSWSNIVFRCAVATGAHPIDLTKTLIQIGHEPIEPIPTRTFFGRPALGLPSVFQYSKKMRIYLKPYLVIQCFLLIFQLDTSRNEMDFLDCTGDSVPKCVQPSSKAWLSRKPLKYSLFKWKERKKSNHLVNFLNFRSLFLHEFHFKGKEIRLLVTTKKKMMKRLLMKHWLPLR